MRFNEIVTLLEQMDPRQAAMDIMLAVAGEGLDSVSLEQMVAELGAMGIQANRETLYDMLVPLDMVDRIEDDVIYFYTTSPESRGSQEKEKDDQTVSNMAKKKIDKEI